MKFLRQNIHLILRLVVNQLGITFFGLVLTMAVSQMENDTFKLLVSLFSIVFYLFLIYSVMWEAGAKNAIPIETGRMKKDPLFSLKASLWASVPNLVLGALMTVFCLVFYIFDAAWADSVHTAIYVITGFAEAMYLGLFSSLLGALEGGVQDAVKCLLYLFSSLPMILVSVGSYALGIRNIHLFGGKAKE